MANCDYYYLNELLGGYFHQDCYDEGVSNDDIIDEYIKTNWPHDRLGLRADITRLLHAHPNDSFDAMKGIFTMNAYPELDNERMAAWLRGVATKLKTSDPE